jgi:GTP-binding protein YchF
MKLGIIGLPQSGKTTIYNALTRQNQPTVISGKIDVHTAMINVPDPRIDRLVNIYHPKKTTPAKISYADIAGLEGRGQGDISGQLRNEMGKLDGFIHVVRCFEDESVPHAAESIDPARDIASMDAELLLNDLISVDAKLERLNAELTRGGRDKGEVQRELAMFNRLQAHLAEDQPLRTMELNHEDYKQVSGYQFLTLKPMLIVLNLGEGQAAPDVSAAVQECAVVPLQGLLEMEIAQLDAEEAELFLAEYGIEEPSLNRMIRESYDLLGLQSFFTVGEDEVRAWTVRRGVRAPEAAGVIHTDLQRGFIRAEVVSYHLLNQLGSWNEARDQGKLRVEGKEYIIQDGDIMSVRFNV